jgi:hypothetical protein
MAQAQKFLRYSQHSRDIKPLLAPCFAEGLGAGRRWRSSCSNELHSSQVFQSANHDERDLTSTDPAAPASD